MNDTREEELRAAAQKMKSACRAYYDSDDSCSECPAYIENRLTGETRCYFSETWTDPCDWDL